MVVSMKLVDGEMNKRALVRVNSSFESIIRWAYFGSGYSVRVLGPGSVLQGLMIAMILVHIDTNFVGQIERSYH